MIMGKTREDVFPSPTDGAFDAGRFQCLGEVCMAYRIRYVGAKIATNRGMKGHCGIVDSKGGLPAYHDKHLIS